MDANERLAIMANAPKLTKKNKRFCEFYNDFTNLDTYGNGAKSALKAGYSESNSAVAAYKLLKKPQILAYIESLEAQTKAQTDISREDFVKILMSKASTTKNEGVQARYWDMIGRAKGFIEPEDNKSASISLFQQLDAKIGQRLQILDNKQVINTTPMMINIDNASNNLSSNQSAVPEISN